MRRMVALVLAGGGGEALSVLTTERAVSAVPRYHSDSLRVR